LPDGKSLPSVDVSSTSFASLDWISNWGSKAIVRAGRDTRDNLRVAIQYLSNPSSRTIYNHVGWRVIEGKPVYLYPGGAIGAQDISVEVELGGGKFGFPDTTENLLEAVSAALTVLDVGELRITLPVLAGAFSAVLSSVLEVDFGIWLVGRSGTFKSSLTALGLSFFGSFDYMKLPANWFSTANNLETLLFRWKDALLAVDNYVPSATIQHRELQAKALRIIQSIGDRSSRGRNSRENEEKARRDPRGLAIFTGEDLPPTNESTIGRLVVVDVPKGAIVLERIREMRKRVHLLPTAMRGYLEWLSADYESRTTQVKELRVQLYEQIRETLASYGVHERAPNNLATLGAGFLSFLTFAREVQVIDDAVFEYHQEQMMEVLTALGRAQVGNAEASPTERYIGILKTLLLQGRVNFAPVDEGLEPNTTPGSKAIGWICRKRNEVYLVPDLTWEVIENFVGRDRWPFKQTRLHRQLMEQSLIKHEQGDDDRDRLTCRRTAGRRTVRVLVFELSTFVDVLTTEPKSEFEVLLKDDLDLQAELDKIFSVN